MNAPNGHRISCPGCGQTLSLATITPGMLASCPKCNRKFRLKGQSASVSVTKPKTLATARPLEAAPQAAPVSRGLGFMLMGCAGLFIALGLFAVAGAFVFMTLRKPKPTVQVVQAPIPEGESKPINKPERIMEEKNKGSGGAAGKPVEPSIDAGKPNEVKGAGNGSKGSGGEERPLPPSTLSGKQVAPLVGVQKYDSSDFGDLRFTEADVEALRLLLIEGGYKPENVIVMTVTRGQQNAALLPTAENILKQLDRITIGRSADDLVLVALTGHGIEPKKRKQSFCAYRARKDDDKTLVSVEEVYRKLGDCKGSMKLLLVDACRNDPEAKGLPEFDGFQNKSEASLAKSVIAFYSCGPGEHSWEPGELKHGLFFHFVLEGLRGKADYFRDGKIVWSNLVGYVNREVRSYSRNHLARPQQPYFKGEAADSSLPLIAWQREKTPVDDKPPEKPANPLVMLDEDFHNIAIAGGIPNGWKGSQFGVKKDMGKRPALECTAPSDIHFITVPPLALSGDFYLEGEYLLQGSSPGTFMGANAGLQQLIIELESGYGAFRAKVVINGDGSVAIGTGQPKKPPVYDLNKITRFRIAREGRVYRVSLNDEIAVSQQIDFGGVIDTVRIGLTAGKPNTGGIGRAANSTEAKLYSLKAGLMLKPGSVPPPLPPPLPPLLVDEDFSKAAQTGGIPDGWNGDKFGCKRDTAQRPCMECTETKGVFYVTLPPLKLSGDFFIEGEFLLHGAAGGMGPGGLGRAGANNNQQFLLLFEGKGGAAKVPVGIDHLGNVALGTSATKKADGYEVHKKARFRVERKGNVYRVLLNIQLVLGVQLSYTGDFETVRIGLTAGKASSAGGGLGLGMANTGEEAKLYSIRVGTSKSEK